MSSRTADYAGKYLRVKRVLGINTAIGAVYFDIPDTLGLRQGLEALMTLSTECEANACGGYDCTLKGIKVEGELASQIISIIGSGKLVLHPCRHRRHTQQQRQVAIRHQAEHQSERR